MNAHRRLGAALFDEALRSSGLSSSDITALLRQELDRDKLSRQTVSEWRHGHQQVPMDVYLAACKVAGVWPIDLLLTVLRRDPSLLAALAPTLPDPDQLIRTLLALGVFVRGHEAN